MVAYCSIRQGRFEHTKTLQIQFDTCQVVSNELLTAMKMEQPRVDPSDWASRRKHAMNRAKEIRSKLKGRDYNETSSMELPLPSKADLQRQRRSRQLEETQRLLDGHINCEKNSFKSDNDSVSRSKARKESGGKDLPRAQQRTGIESHSVISKEQLGHLQSQYKNTHFSDISNESTKKHGLPLTEEKMTEADSSQSPCPTPESSITAHVHERPLEGRGRGRGRGRSTIVGKNAHNLGEMSLSSRSIWHNHQVSERSPRTSQITYPDDAMKSPPSKPSLSFLRERRVPGYKEGECEKLAVLRRKLVSRRNNNDKAMKGHYTENAPERLKTTTMIVPNHPYSRDSYNEEGETVHNKIPSRIIEATLEHDKSIISSGRINQSKLTLFSVNQGSEYKNMNDEEPIVEIELIQCHCCKRSFAPMVYEKHFDQDGQPKCEGQLSKKRPVYNSAKSQKISQRKGKMVGLRRAKKAASGEKNLMLFERP
eukprot:CCRYP_017270-RA/>CCRYP_017270-RA protein AED:0.16 eAED:0.14 QI:0/0.6/0.16/1/0.6/0.33/6/0/480